MATTAKGSEVSNGTGPGGLQPPHVTKRAANAERDFRIYQWRVQEKTLRWIAAQVGLTEARVSQICKRMIQARSKEMADGMAAYVLEQRVLAMAKLDAQEAKVWEVIERRHFTVNAGQVVRMPTYDADGILLDPVEHPEAGALMEDDNHVLTAINGALDKINKRRAALLGLDAPTRSEVTGTYNYTVNGVNLETLQ
jgi:hypothetical protein